MKMALLGLALLSLPLSACSQQPVQANQSNSEQTSSEQSMNASKSEQIQGQLVYKDLEGGFYGFIGDNGRNYTLRNLAPEYKQNGIRLAVTGHVRDDILTITQFGSVFEVEAVKVLDDSQVSPINDTH